MRRGRAHGNHKIHDELLRRHLCGSLDIEHPFRRLVPLETRSGNPKRLSYVDTIPTLPAGYKPGVSVSKSPLK